MSLAPLPESLNPLLDEYLVPGSLSKPFVTLTYAQSLDSKISSLVGVQTKISHVETKTLTHHIRSRHDSILVGIGTVLADDPKLNCRLGGDSSSSPRPVIIDPKGRWNYASSQLRKIVDNKNGKAPFIVTDLSESIGGESLKVLEQQGGKQIKLPLQEKRYENWDIILSSLYELGIKSVMVEGGATVINDLLAYKNKDGRTLIDSLIITIGPVFLGRNGVDVSPSEHVDLNKVKWWTGIQDSVLFAKVVLN
ncbi:uncharacterized protein PRCAT00000883001 [Priceomyces carsonii]|uniref:uncharacterized protein n=1 Tax=Priceomyces carsonii TaxID=28549 RepID=UPI002ED92FE9|nr:unnamed protein product [Priceomyces carsonii]